MTNDKKGLGVVCAMMVLLAAVASGAERFPWLTDLDEARALAAEQGKPLLIVFRCEP